VVSYSRTVAYCYYGLSDVPTKSLYFRKKHQKIRRQSVAYSFTLRVNWHSLQE